MQRIINRIVDATTFPLIRCRSFKGRVRLIRMLLAMSTCARSYYGPKLRPQMGDWTNRAAFLGLYGNELSEFIHSLPHDAIFIDIGANYGIFSLLAGQHLTEGHVFAFEPNPYVYKVLVENIEANNLRNVSTFNFGISDRTARLPFSYSATHTGGGTITNNGDNCPYIFCMSFLSILPAIAVRPGQHVMCKIDVEGHEASVLKSIEESGFLNSISSLFVEVDNDNLKQHGSSCRELYDHMEQCGFKHLKAALLTGHYDQIFTRPASETVGSPPSRRLEESGILSAKSGS